VPLIAGLPYDRWVRPKASGIFSTNMSFVLALVISAHVPAGNSAAVDSKIYDLPSVSHAAMTADAGFKATNLSPEMQFWHGRMLDAMQTSTTTIDGRSKSGNTYELGRYLNDYTTALLNALRATGDRRFLDRAAQLWDQARVKQADAWLDGTKDGYVNWLWLETPGDFHYVDRPRCPFLHRAHPQT
jgi:hypothetical protein